MEIKLLLVSCLTLCEEGYSLVIIAAHTSDVYIFMIFSAVHSSVPTGNSVRVCTCVCVSCTQCVSLGPVLVSAGGSSTGEVVAPPTTHLLATQ